MEQGWAVGQPAYPRMRMGRGPSSLTSASSEGFVLPNGHCLCGVPHSCYYRGAKLCFHGRWAELVEATRGRGSGRVQVAKFIKIFY